jgi:uncharacterized Ntn-hydrolase superfamily protein
MKAALCLLGLLALPVRAQIYAPGEEGTFSIIGRDPATGELGIAVQSHTISVGSRVRGGKGGLAVFAHQAASDPMFDEIGIQLLEAGMTPQQALDFMLKADGGGKQRQVAILDIQGRSASWTSPTLTDWKGHRSGVNYCAQGNTLVGPAVVDNMADSFEHSSGPLAERLLDALEAGQRGGGDKRGMESAGLLVLKPLSVQGYGDKEIDLRVDEAKNPFVELRRILNAVRSGELRNEVTERLKADDLPGAYVKAAAARDKSPEIDANWISLAEVQVRMNHPDEAISSLSKAVELNPANKRQLPLTKAFKSLLSDPRFQTITST